MLGADEVLLLGGCGSKILAVLLGQADLFCYQSPGSHRWDICAGEVLIHCLGGSLTDTQGHRYFYGSETTRNQTGVLVGFGSQRIERGIRGSQ